MADIATVLKEEIRRLARKELKEPLGALRKVNAQQRHDIAALKRESAELRRRIADLEAATRRVEGSVSQSTDGAPRARFSPAWVIKHREKLGLTQAQYAALVGVSSMTIHNWERGHTRPAESQLSAWAAVRNLGKREALRRLGD